MLVIDEFWLPTENFENATTWKITEDIKMQGIAVMFRKYNINALLLMRIYHWYTFRANELLFYAPEEWHKKYSMQKPVEQKAVIRSPRSARVIAFGKSFFITSQMKISNWSTLLENSASFLQITMDKYAF